MRTSPRVFEVTLPEGQVLLCRVNAVVSGIVTQAARKHGPGADNLLVVGAIVEVLPALLDAGAVTGWRGVTDERGGPRRFVAAEVADLLWYDELVTLASALAAEVVRSPWLDAAMAAGATDEEAAASEGGPDPTGDGSEPMS